ncbi:unnamed protein product [Hermetia illucens]|uniref:Uncharacterized protein n=1 Tax=Hermetia illucens TaxID=343691 RepID=A0A7R8UJ76_HERIL|nr:unnamed protein product [Hermetia illucens]
MPEAIADMFRKRLLSESSRRQRRLFEWVSGPRRGPSGVSCDLGRYQFRKRTTICIAEAAIPDYAIEIFDAFQSMFNFAKFDCMNGKVMHHKNGPASNIGII